MKTAFLTMDVESFYDTSCIKKKGIAGSCSCAEQVEVYLDLLRAYDAKSTLFVTVDFIKECKSSLLRAIAEGHEIALHALVHESPVKYTKAYFKECIARAKEIIEEELGVEVKGYRAPCFGIDADKVEILKELGFLYDSSALNFKAAYGAGSLDIGEYRKINDSVYCDGDFFEVKPTTLSGGAYLRLTPWNMTKSRIERYFKRSDAYVFYVHPFEIYRGEFPDHKQLSAFDRMFVNGGRKEYIKKIEYLFDRLRQEDFSFPTISGYLEGLKGERGEHFQIGIQGDHGAL